MNPEAAWLRITTTVRLIHDHCHEVPVPRRAQVCNVMRIPPGEEPPSELLLFRAGANANLNGAPILFDADAGQAAIQAIADLPRGLNINYHHSDVFPVDNGPRVSAGEFRLAVKEETSRVLVGYAATGEPAYEDVPGPTLWAVDIQWTQKAAALITGREMRYYSPEFFTGKGKRLEAVCGLALTNDPALLHVRPILPMAAERGDVPESLREALQQIGANLWPDAGDVYVDDILVTSEVIFEAYWRDDTGSVVRQTYFRAPYVVADEIPSLTAQPVEVERHVEYRPLAAMPVAVEAQATDRSMTMDLTKLTEALMAAYPDATVKAPMAAFIVTADGQNMLVPHEMAEDGTVTLGEAIPVSVGDAEQQAAAQREMTERIETLSREHTASLETARTEGLQTLEAERVKIAAREQALASRDGELRKAVLELGLFNGTLTVSQRSLAEKWDLPTLLSVTQKGAKQFTAERERATPANIGGDKPKGKATGGRFVDGVLRFD